MSKDLTTYLFYGAVITGVILRIIAMVFYAGVRNVKVNLTPSQVLGMLEKETKSVYRINLIHKPRFSPIYAYSESLNIQTGELTLGCEEDSDAIYDICAVIHGYFVHKSASIKRSHYNFSKIMSVCVGIFSVISLILAVTGKDNGDVSMMINAMSIYLVTFLCTVITSDFDIIATIDSLSYIKTHNIFGVNYYYARRVLLGYFFHKVSRAAAVILLPASVIMGLFL